MCFRSSRFRSGVSFFGETWPLSDPGAKDRVAVKRVLGRVGGGFFLGLVWTLFG